MEFEFDREKSLRNKAKHGIDFTEAQALWDDISRVVIPAKTEDEPREITIGRIAGRHWTGITTNRGEKVKIISVRRARSEEREIYES